MEKAEQRKRARQARRLLTGQGVGTANVAICDRVVEAILSRGSAIVAAYWPMGDEVDIRPAIQKLTDAGIELALPTIRAAGQPLVFRRWRPGDELRSGPHGTSEPLEESDTLTPGVVIVPLLAYDRDGYRIGYGGGYYDRTLAELRSGPGEPWALGAAFHGQMIDRVCRDDHDEPLDAVATEHGLTHFPDKA